MSLKDAVEDLKFDSRMLKANLRTKKITEEEYQKYLEQLPDSSENAVQLGSVDSKDQMDAAIDAAESASLESHSQ